MKIEVANIFDVKPAAVLFNAYRVFYGKPSDPEAAQRFLSERMIHQQSVILLAQDEKGAYVGFAQLYPIYSSVSMRKKFLLNDLFVTPQARGTGRGKALLDKAKVVAREYGAISLTLSTAIENESAQQLYRSNGWELDKDYLTFEFSPVRPLRSLKPSLPVSIMSCGKRFASGRTATVPLTARIIRLRSTGHSHQCGNSLW